MTQKRRDPAPPRAHRVDRPDGPPLPHRVDAAGQAAPADGLLVVEDGRRAGAIVASRDGDAPVRD